MPTSHPQRSWGTCGKSGFLGGGALNRVMHIAKQVENQQTHNRNLWKYINYAFHGGRAGGAAAVWLAQHVVPHHIQWI